MGNERLWNIGGMILARKSWSTGRKPSLSANFSRINPTWNGLGSKSALHGERPVTNRPKIGGADEL